MFYPLTSRDYKDELNWNVTKKVRRTEQKSTAKILKTADEDKRIKLTNHWTKVELQSGNQRQRSTRKIESYSRK